MITRRTWNVSQQAWDTIDRGLDEIERDAEEQEAELTLAEVRRVGVRMTSFYLRGQCTRQDLRHGLEMLGLKDYVAGPQKIQKVRCGRCGIFGHDRLRCRKGLAA